jgi:hypothetical protein
MISMIAMRIIALGVLGAVATFGTANGAGIDDLLQQQRTRQQKQIDQIKRLEKPLVDCVIKQAHSYEIYSSSEKTDVAARAAVGLCSKEEGAYRSALFELGILIPDIDASTIAQQNHERLVETALTIIVAERRQQLAASSADQKDRFFEFQFGPGKNRVYDFQTVQVIQPGGFTIVSTLIDNGDLMTFELKALDSLRDYCKRSDGNYPPPSELFIFGQPDLPIVNIEIKTVTVTEGNYQHKTASWSYPYKRFAIEDRGGDYSPARGYLVCKDGRRDESELFREQRKRITNGERNKEMFDCKRGLWGDLASEDINASLINLDRVTPHTVGDRLYHDICQRVTHETPYQSE